MRAGLSEYIRDEKGERVPLWMPRLGAGDDDGVPREVRDRLRSATDQAGGHAGHRLVILASLPVSIVVLISSGSHWLLYSGAAAAIIGGFLMERRARWAAVTEEVRTTLLGAGYCASCGYDLRGVPRSGEGLARCPECRAVWRLPETIGTRADDEGRTSRAAAGAGDQPQWKRGSVGRALEDAGAGFLLARGSYSVLDDRGRAVEVVYPWVERRPPSCWGEIPPERRQAIQRRLSALGRIGRWLSMSFLPVAVMAGLLLLANSRGHLDVLMGLLMLAWAVSLLGVLLYPGVRDRRKIVNIMLAYQRCASCAADLTDVAPDADGVQDCPRCRSAWRPDPDAAVMRWVRWEEERRAGKKPRWRST